MRRWKRRLPPMADNILDVLIDRVLDKIIMEMEAEEAQA